MSTEAWDPRSGIVSLREAMDRLREGGRFDRIRGMPLDLRDEGDQYVVTAVLPGIRPEDIEVRVSGNRLEIRGEMREETEREVGHWLLRERDIGRVERIETLPGRVDAEQASTHYEHGVLTVRLPKVARPGARRIPVQPGGGSARSVMGTEEQEATAGLVRPRTPSTPAGEAAGAEAARRPVDRAQVREGMDVVGPEGGHIGTVKAVRERDFLIDRSMQRDVYAPFDAVMEVAGTRVVLAVGPGQIDAMDWEQPELLP